jgi:hypothetical protein
MRDDQLAIRAEAQLDPLARRRAHFFDGCADEAAKRVARARVGVARSLHACHDHRTVGRNDKDSAEIQLDSVGVKAN